MPRITQTLILSLIATLTITSSGSAFTAKTALGADRQFSLHRVGANPFYLRETPQQNSLGYGGFASDSPLASRGAGLLSKLKLRPDIVLKGGRSGQNVKNLTGPANSVLKGSPGRIFITNKKGQVIMDVTKDRIKPVMPGRGFGEKILEVGDDLLELIRKMHGG